MRRTRGNVEIKVNTEMDTLESQEMNLKSPRTNKRKSFKEQECPVSENVLVKRDLHDWDYVVTA